MRRHRESDQDGDILFGIRNALYIEATAVRIGMAGLFYYLGHMR